MIHGLLIVFALLFSSRVVWSQNGLTPSVRFIIVSDEGGLASNDQKNVAAAMAKEAERMKAQFVVTAGDNYHENGIASATDPRWKTEFEDVYSFSSLQIPWYPSLGNHDNRGNVVGEIEHSKLSVRWKLPARYYSQTERIDDSTSILIVHLDTSPFITQYRMEPDEYHMKGLETKGQLFWLDSVLTATRVRWSIVVGHHPIYSAASKHGDTKELIDQVLPILKKHNVPLYVCGHDHILQHLRRGVMDFVICGGGAKHRDVDQRDDVIFGAGSLGFASVTVTARDITVNFIDSNNVMLHAVHIPATQAK
jgi:acid phosphatase